MGKVTALGSVMLTRVKGVTEKVIGRSGQVGAPYGQAEAGGLLPSDVDPPGPVQQQQRAQQQQQQALVERENLELAVSQAGGRAAVRDLRRRDPCRCVLHRATPLGSERPCIVVAWALLACASLRRT